MVKNNDAALIKADFKAVEKLNKELEAKLKTADDKIAGLEEQLKNKPDDSQLKGFITEFENLFEQYTATTRLKLKTDFLTDMEMLIVKTKASIK